MKTIFQNTRHPFLKMTWVPSRRIIDAHGATTITPPKRIEFANGKYETDDPNEIKFIRSRIILNANIIEISPKEQKAIAQRIEDEKEVREALKKKREAREKKEKEDAKEK